MSVRPTLELAFAHYQAGRVDEAAAACRKVLAVAPRTGDALHLLGIIAHRAGRQDEAAEHVRGAVAANPRQAEYRNTLGVIERASGRIGTAIETFRAALEIEPRHAQAAANLGNALAQSGQFADAAEAYRRALRLAPNSPGIHNNLGNVLRELGEVDAAVESFSAALRLNPNYVEARTNLGVALMSAERYDEALAAYRAALALDPNHLPALANIGNALLVSGYHPEAIANYDRALAIKPDFPEVHLNVVALQNYLDDATAERTLAFARRYGASLPTGPRPPFRNDPDPGRRLRVGLVSADLRNHPVGRFLRPVLSHRDPDRIEFVAYSTTHAEDAMTGSLRRDIVLWRQIKGVPAARAAELIATDEVDVLVDLSGYTDGARLDIFARKPAPVQFGWLGYSGTTGIPGMDYILADRWVAPEGSEGEFSETVYRLPDSYLCFGTPDWPVTGALPARKGHVTFGSFNNIGKVSRQTLDAWIEVLRAVPDSHLLLKSSKGGVQARLDELEASFTAAGIDASRLRFIDRVPDRAAHMALYDEVDIGLDPFPYNGTTTSCEALWMGVPVLARRGDSFVSRVGESLMQTLGLPEWVAGDTTDYVARAARLAADIDGLATLRSTLRDRFARSPLGDEERFARSFEGAVRQMWTRWCETQGGP